MAKREPITTKQFIAQLLELDPDGNRRVWVDVVGDGWYSGTVYNNQVDIYDDDSIVITLPFDDDDEETEN